MSAARPRKGSSRLPAESSSFCSPCRGAGRFAFNRHGTIAGCDACGGSGRQPTPCIADCPWPGGCGLRLCAGCGARCLYDCSCADSDVAERALHFH